MIQLDGVSTTVKDRILIVGATNRPHELDEAARRRFEKRLYIPLPETSARRHIVSSLFSDQKHAITVSQFEKVARRTDGYSCADMKVLCQEASMGPIRSLSFEVLKKVPVKDIRPVTFNDFVKAMENVRSSVSQNDLQKYVDWNNIYGSGSRECR